MGKRFALSDYLASMDQIEKKIDRSTKAIERCIDHLAEIEGRVRRDQLARAQAGWPGKTPAAIAAPDADRRLRS